MEGGSANDYDYCSGDPVNCNDLSGQLPPPAQTAWCLKWGPYACGVGKAASLRAVKAAANIAREFGGDEQIGNAFQHAYWMALVAYWVGAEAALELGVAHEIDNQVSYCGDSVQESEKDMMNNLTGIGDGTKAFWPGSIYGGVRRSLERGRLNCIRNGAIKKC